MFAVINCARPQISMDSVDVCDLNISGDGRKFYIISPCPVKVPISMVWKRKPEWISLIDSI